MVAGIKSPSAEFFEYIAWPLDYYNGALTYAIDVAAKMRKWRSLPPVRYLEIGCGIGTKLSMAMRTGLGTVHGLEVNETYAEMAEKVVRHAKCGNSFQCDTLVIRCDARRFARYGEYNMFYTWAPLAAAVAGGRNYDLYAKVYSEAPMYSLFLNFAAPQYLTDQKKITNVWPMGYSGRINSVCVKAPSESEFREIESLVNHQPEYVI